MDEFLVKHPNADCRFLYFGNVSYLEFIHAPDKKKSLKYPGFSFGARSNLNLLFKSLEKKKIKCHYYHRNYNWRLDSVNRLPGWNFLEFKKLGFRSFYPWVTEYEPNPNRKKVTKKIKHPNGVERIHGHEFILNDVGRKFFERLLNIKVEAQAKLSCGTVLYFKKGRTNYHSKVILKTSSLNRTKKSMVGTPLIVFEGQEGIHIRNPSKMKSMWDLLIIE